MSNLTLDEAIKHCEEVANQKEISAITYKNCKEFKANIYEKLTAEIAENDCTECAADHRQLAKWLTELKESKKLLKMAVEDLSKMPCNKDTYSPDSCYICVKHGSCSYTDSFKWCYADIALKLIGDDTNMPEYIERGKALDKLIEGDGDDEFTEGYNFAVNEYREKIKALPSADVQSVDRWISVDDKLPVTTMTCLIWYEYDSLWGRFRDYGISWYSGNGWYQGYLNGDNIEILYWQDLPEPPKDGEADVQIAKQGHWIEKAEEYYRLWQDSGRSWDDMPYFVTGLNFACPHCFKQYDVNAEGVEDWEFCPKCGADMREKE